MLANDPESLLDPKRNAARRWTIISGMTAAAAVVVRANKRDSQPLDPGIYLVCVRSSCVNIDVTAGHVTTLNVAQAWGSLELMVAKRGERTTHSANSLNIGF